MIWKRRVDISHFTPSLPFLHILLLQNKREPTALNEHEDDAMIFLPSRLPLLKLLSYSLRQNLRKSELHLTVRERGKCPYKNESLSLKKSSGRRVLWSVQIWLKLLRLDEFPFGTLMNKFGNDSTPHYRHWRIQMNWQGPWKEILWAVQIPRKEGPSWRLNRGSQRSTLVAKKRGQRTGESRF